MKIQIFHFNQEQIYKVKKRNGENEECSLEITLQKIKKNYKSQFLSYNFKSISIFNIPLRVAGILFIFGRQMLNKAFLDLEHITVILFKTDSSLTSGSISANRSNGSKQASPFFSAFVIPASIQSLEITYFSLGVVM